MIRAVIFDFNGVLIDDEHLHFELFRDLASELGVALTEQEYHEVYLGYDDRRCFEEVLRDAGQAADASRLDKLVARKAALYKERAAHGLRVFPGAADCLAALADRWPVAINSGALKPEIELALRQMGVLDRVSAIISAEDTADCKPDPEGYELALDALRSSHGEDLEAGHCLVLEDSLAGVQSAKGAGMWVVGVPNTYSEPQLRAAGADAVIAGLESFGPESVRLLFSPEVTP
jgi:HAD superfamily hydrolase (TIGR01509 family)